MDVVSSRSPSLTWRWPPSRVPQLPDTLHRLCHLRRTPLRDTPPCTLRPLHTVPLTIANFNMDLWIKTRQAVTSTCLSNLSSALPPMTLTLQPQNPSRGGRKLPQMVLRLQLPMARRTPRPKSKELESRGTPTPPRPRSGSKKKTNRRQSQHLWLWNQ